MCDITFVISFGFFVGVGVGVGVMRIFFLQIVWYWSIIASRMRRGSGVLRARFWFTVFIIYLLHYYDDVYYTQLHLLGCVLPLILSIIVHQIVLSCLL